MTRVQTVYHKWIKLEKFWSIDLFFFTEKRSCDFMLEGQNKALYKNVRVGTPSRDELLWGLLHNVFRFVYLNKWLKRRQELQSILGKDEVFEQLDTGRHKLSERKMWAGEVCKCGRQSSWYFLLIVFLRQETFCDLHCGARQLITSRGDEWRHDSCLGNERGVRVARSAAWNFSYFQECQQHRHMPWGHKWVEQRLCTQQLQSKWQNLFPSKGFRVWWPFLVGTLPKLCGEGWREKQETSEWTGRFLQNGKPSASAHAILIPSPY